MIVIYRSGSDFMKTKKIHFIGVSGIGVSAVAQLSIKRGYTVSGSALEKNHLTEKLEELGMKFYLGHKADNIDDSDLIVRSAAVKDDNPEVQEGFNKGIDVIYYSKYLGMLMSEKEGLAIAGTHGKTTTTAMIATIISHAGLDPEVVCGGIMKEFGSNAIYGNGKYFIAEACEYNRSFLDLNKKYGVITNIEPDHLDYYGSFKNILSSFREFVNKTDKSGSIIVNGDDKSISDIISDSDIEIVKIGYNKENDIIIDSIKEIEGKYKYTLWPNGSNIAAFLNNSISIELSIPGRFNIINSALASVLALRLGVKPGNVIKSIQSFKGTERRLEVIGMYMGNPVISDYAHHPTEISATIDAIKKAYPGRYVFAVFQPHQYSRTALLFDRFVNALSKADYLILTKIYRQRDSAKFVKMVKSKDLFDEIKKVKWKNVFFVDNIKDVWKFIQNFIKSDNLVILFMGAGDIDKYARAMLF